MIFGQLSLDTFLFNFFCSNFFGDNFFWDNFFGKIFFEQYLVSIPLITLVNRSIYNCIINILISGLERDLAALGERIGNLEEGGEKLYGNLAKSGAKNVV